MKKIKKNAKFGGSHKPTHDEKTKRLRHNEKQIFCLIFLFVFAFHPSGLIPFPFGFFPTPPTDLLSFFFFFVLFFSFFFVLIFMGVSVQGLCLGYLHRVPYMSAI